MALVLTNARDRRLLAAVALFLLSAGTSSSLAQKTPKLPSGTGGIGGGAGHVPTLPDFRPVPMAPAAPSVTVPTAPPVAAPAPAPAPIIRFRCEVAPGTNTCKEQPTPDGGGDETCDCTRDFCYTDAAGARICEKP